MKRYEREENFENIKDLHMRECSNDLFFFLNEKDLLRGRVLDSKEDCVNIESLTKKR